MTWNFLIKKKRESTYLNITDYLAGNVSINIKLSTQLKTFNLEFARIRNLVDERVSIEIGDTILVTKNDLYNEPILFGRVKELNSDVTVFDHDDLIWEKDFKISCREPNFSTNRVSGSYTSKNLSYILDDLVNKASNLGGIKLDGTFIEKYKLLCSDITIDYFSVDNKSLLDAIVQLCKENNLYFRVDYYSEADATDLVKVYSQLIIMDENGEPAPEPFYTIDDNSLLYGLQKNPNYIEGSTVEPEYLYGWTLPCGIDSDGDDIKNDLLIIAKVLNSTGSMTRYTPDSIDGQTNYILPSPANEIYYVSNNKLVGCSIRKDISPTTTTFYIESTQAVHIKATDIIKIVSTDLTKEDFREVASVNVTTGAIQITLPLSFTPIGNESVELVNNMPIYKENDPKLSYERTGCIVKIASDEKASIEFLPFSIPGRPNKLSVYYSELSTKKIRIISDESKSDYELNTFDYELKNAITNAQLQELTRRAEQLTLNDSIRLKAFLPVLPKAGWQTQFNLSGVLNKNLRLNSIAAKYYGTSDEEIDIIEQTLDYSNKSNSFEAYLKSLEKSLERASITAYEEKIQKISESISIIDAIEVLKNLNPPIITSIASITYDGFTINYTGITDAVEHLLDISTDETFTNIIASFNQKTIGITGTYNVTGLSSITSTNTFYLRLRGFTSTGRYSNYSSTTTVLRVLDLQKDSNTLAFYGFQNNYTDTSGNSNNATGINSPVFTTNLLKYETYSLRLDGSNDAVSIPTATSNSRDITLRWVLSFNSFTRDMQLLYSDWYSSAPYTNFKGKITVYYRKSTQSFEIYLYDDTYSEVFTNKVINIAATGINLNINTKYLIQFSWNNTTKTPLICVNNTSYSSFIERAVTPPSSLTIATMNLQDAPGSPTYLGAYTYDGSLYTLNSPDVKLARFVIDNVARNFTFHQQDYTNIESRLISPNLQIDSNTLIAFDLNEGTGTSLSSRSPATTTSTIQGTTTSIWQPGTIDAYSLDFNGTNNYLSTPNMANPSSDFSIRLVLRFETGDKASKTFHPLLSKYNGTVANSASNAFITEYIPSTNKLYFYIYDATDTSGTYNMRYYSVTAPTLNENQDYIIQFSFKLVDPSNSNLNTVEICLNGVKLSGGTWTNSRVGFTNISSVKTASSYPIEFNSYNDGSRRYSKNRVSKVYMDGVFRSEAFALQDAQNIGLA